MSHEPREVVLPDSGATVRVKFVGPLLMNDIRKAAMKGLVKPTPPMQEVPYQTGTRLEPNPLHPDYESALKDYDAALGLHFLEKLFRYGVDYTLTDADKARVTALRADGDLDLPADDLQLFITRFLVATEADLTALQLAILGRAQPTETAVAAAIESFRPNLPGA